MSTEQPFSKELIASLLRDAAERVISGDTYEGTISFSIVDESLDARYRIGNQGGGQGGMRMVQIGLPPPADPPLDYIEGCAVRCGQCNARLCDLPECGMCHELARGQPADG